MNLSCSHSLKTKEIHYYRESVLIIINKSLEDSVIQPHTIVNDDSALIPIVIARINVVGQ